MNNQHPQQQQMGSGLARYRSAPSSFFDTILNGGFDEDQLLFNPHQTHTIFSKLVGSSISTSSDAILQENTSSSDHFQTQSHQQLINSQFLSTTNNHSIVQKSTTTDYSTLIMYNNQATSGTPISAAESNNDNSSIKMGNSGGGLIRHSSSPAGFFANLDIQKAEFGAMRGMDNSGPGNTSNAEGSFSSAIKFKRHIDFSSKNYSSSGMMAPISKIGKKRSGENSPGQGEGHFVEDRSDNGGDYVPGFSTNSWNNSQMMSDDFFEGFVDNNDETFTNANILDTTNNEGGKWHAPLLSHRHSLPASSAEFFAMENQLEDSVPCKIRAKRGFATHPRSIAERVRRTNISNRIKKLQVLVPNMEKQTNTADMLDLAVDYIKDLQRQVKKLSDNGAKCKCTAKEKS